MQLNCSWCTHILPPLIYVCNNSEELGDRVSHSGSVIRLDFNHFNGTVMHVSTKTNYPHSSWRLATEWWNKLHNTGYCSYSFQRWTAVGGLLWTTCNRFFQKYSKLSSHNGMIVTKVKGVQRLSFWLHPCTFYPTQPSFYIVWTTCAVAKTCAVTVNGLQLHT